MVKSWKVFDVLLELELEVGVSLNASDDEKRVWQGKYVRGRGFAGEFEEKLKDNFLSGVKVEFDKKDGVVISFVKEIKAHKYLQLSPHVVLSEEFFKVEAELQQLDWTWTIGGLPVQVFAKPKATLIFKLDWFEVIKDRVKKKVKDWLRDRLQDLVELLGRRAATALGAKILAALFGSIGVALFVADPPNTPPSAPDDDVGGKNEALAWAAGAATRAAYLQAWATIHRRAFAVAYADTVRLLMQKDWRAHLENVLKMRAPGFANLPGPSAPAAEWQSWASTDKALSMVSLPPSGQAHDHFRWYEYALMFAAAALLLRLITRAQLDDVVKVCVAQATLAGASLARVAVQRSINRRGYRYQTADGAIVLVDGAAQWDAATSFFLRSGITPDEINERLAALALRELPPL